MNRDEEQGSFSPWARAGRHNPKQSHDLDPRAARLRALRDPHRTPEAGPQDCRHPEGETSRNPVRSRYGLFLTNQQSPSFKSILIADVHHEKAHCLRSAHSVSLHPPVRLHHQPPYHQVTNNPSAVQGRANRITATAPLPCVKT